MLILFKKKILKTPEEEKKRQLLLEYGREQFRKLNQIGVNFPVLTWRA